MNVLAVDIGGTSVKIGVFTHDLEMISSESTTTNEFKSSELFVDFLCAEIDKFQKSHKINSVGIGIPGSTNKDGLMINISNIPIIKDINLRKEINLKLNSEINIPIFIDNDANVAALYESRFGEGASFDNFIYVTLGTGIGGAIVINGELFRGESSSAGEIGFVMIDYDGEQKVLEDFIGRKSFLKYSHKKLKKYLDIKDISNLAAVGDEVAVELMQYYGEILAIGLVSVMNLLDIPNVVLGGGVSSCTEIMYDGLKQEINSSALPNISDNFTLKKSKLFGQVGLFGAASLAILQK